LPPTGNRRGRRQAVFLGFDGQPVKFNTPTVFNASLNFKQFWNGRVDTLEAQIEQVVISPAEMGSDWKTVVANLTASPSTRPHSPRCTPTA
jgi:cytochrome c peroxidase